MMDWESPKLLLLGIPLLLLLVVIEQRSVHPLTGVRKRLLLWVRGLAVLVALAALAGPARVVMTQQRALGLVVDASQSLDEAGLRAALGVAERLRSEAGVGVQWFGVGMGREPWLAAGEALEWNESWAKAQRELGGESDYEAGIAFATGLFPPGASRDLVLIGDGEETRGDVLRGAREAAGRGVTLHAAPVAGPEVPDLRVVSLRSTEAQVREGAGAELVARLQATRQTEVLVTLFENGIEVEKRMLALAAGEVLEERFLRNPGRRGLFRYRVRVEGMESDMLPQNNEQLALINVLGRLRLLWILTDEQEAEALKAAMVREEIELETTTPEEWPGTMEALAGYDGVMLSSVSAHRLGEPAMRLLREYVELLGGGLLMLGSGESFGLGGYFQTPLEEVLPVRLRAPDEEEKQSAALALVVDRSGSMTGEKLEMAKSAAIATAEVLGRSDYLGVFAFDSEGKTVAPMTRLSSRAVVAGQIATMAAGGGTNLEPALQMAREGLLRTKARVKHMIVLTDGQTSGGGYEGVASMCRAEGITISTVAIGEGSHVALLQAVAAAGGGQAYSTVDVAGITRIFTQDTLTHTGRMLREEPFESQRVERHPMLEGFDVWDPPPLLGYVKTLPKASAQIPLVTAEGDPLLAHWRFGLGKVTAFTSDASSRWASLWIARWDGFNRFWAQVLRETSRPMQGRMLDLECTEEKGEVRLRAELMEDGGTRAQDASVKAEVFRVAEGVGGESLELQRQMNLDQRGPGSYEGRFQPNGPGMYLVRVQSGAETASAGVVYQPSEEAALGTVDEGLLAQVAAIGGGGVIEGAEGRLELQAKPHPIHRELWPVLLLLLLPLLLLDLMIRRWEHVLGLVQSLRP